MNDDHIPVPLAHTPNVEMHVEGSGISLEGQNSDAWLYSDYTVEVEQ